MSTPEQDAKVDLLVLELATEDLFRGDLVLLEVSKALTVATMHVGVEAKVVCRNAKEVTQALSIIYSHKLQEREHAKWNPTEGCLELPNGSAVSVWLAGKRAVPK